MLLPALGIGLIVLGTVQQWEHVGTLRWWTAVGGGVILGVAFAVVPVAAMVLAVLGVIGIAVGLGDSVGGSNRVLFSAVGIGVLLTFAAQWAARNRR